MTISRKRRIVYPIGGAVLALGAPCGYLFLRAVGGWVPWTLSAGLQEVRGNAPGYAYLTFATITVFAVLGYLLGRKEDMVRASNTKLREQEKALREAYDLVVEKDAQLHADLRQASHFQQSILTRPPAVAGVRIDLLYHPLDLVGGDVYYVLQDGDSLRVFLADVRGHGVEAALPTMLVMSEYEIIRNEKKGPADTLALLNARFASTYARLGLHFTATCLDLDLRTGRVQYASAAHPELCVVGPGGDRELETGGTFVGLIPDATFPEWTVQLQRGDRLVMYTDGVTEQWDGRGELFGSHRLLRSIREARDQHALASDTLLTHLRGFVEGEPRFSDDVTLLEICWSPEPEARTGDEPVAADQTRPDAPRAA